MDRITKDDLERLAKRINKATGSPLEPWSKDEHGKLKANVGNYYLSGAYGGVKLERVCSESGGCDDISTDGFGTKRQLYTWMHAFLAGVAVQGGAA